MPDEVRCEVNGLEGLLSELRELPQRFQTRILKGAVGTGAGVLRDEARRLAPIYLGADRDVTSLMGWRIRNLPKDHPPPGTLKAAIYSARLSSQCTPTKEVWIFSVRQGKKFRAVAKGGTTQNQDAFYARWIEYGHWTRPPKGPGPRAARRDAAIKAGTVRWVPPQPFMRPAFDTKKDEAFRAMTEYIRKNLPAALVGMQFLKALAA